MLIRLPIFLSVQVFSTHTSTMISVLLLPANSNCIVYCTGFKQPINITT